MAFWKPTLPGSLSRQTIGRQERPIVIRVRVVLYENDVLCPGTTLPVSRCHPPPSKQVNMLKCPRPHMRYKVPLVIAKRDCQYWWSSLSSALVSPLPSLRPAGVTSRRRWKQNKYYQIWTKHKLIVITQQTSSNLQAATKLNESLTGREL